MIRSGDVEAALRITLAATLYSGSFTATEYGQF